MSSLSDRLNTEDEIPTLREPDDLDNPDPMYAPFELKESSRSAKLSETT
ncbi:hypothetical protein GCM10009066_00310 [Halarchaeum salinum]|uniref:Uncharacterized protein n=1 Tax=Halarchaeum salinum TaxID=489912 RepID=A0AAV3S4Q1_9EURY